MAIRCDNQRITSQYNTRTKTSIGSPGVRATVRTVQGPSPDLSSQPMDCTTPEQVNSDEYKGEQILLIVLLSFNVLATDWMILFYND